MGKDGRLEVFPIAVTVGDLLDRLDLGIEAFGGGSGYASYREEVANAIEVMPDHVGNVDGGL